MRRTVSPAGPRGGFRLDRGIGCTGKHARKHRQFDELLDVRQQLDARQVPEVLAHDQVAPLAVPPPELSRVPLDERLGEPAPAAWLLVKTFYQPDEGALDHPE